MNQPVRRAGSREYVLLTMISFAVSVIATRLFLQLTGYPQVGGSTLHIAHVLWGGLLLFLASLLPLVFANRWVYRVTALLSGAGVGLFIDEVGKFITRTNDYFFPAAAPIIYGFFLMVVLVYLQVRRPPARNSRARLYESLDELAEVLDRDMGPRERRHLERLLRPVAEDSSQPDMASLAGHLLQFLASGNLYLAREERGPWGRLVGRVRGFESRHLGRAGVRALLIAGMALLSVYRVAQFVIVLATGSFTHMDTGRVIDLLGAAGPMPPAPAELDLVKTGLQLAAVIPVAVAAVLLLLGRESRGINLARAGLVVSLIVVDLVVFYVDQFGAVAGSILELSLLLLATYYQGRYLRAR